MGYKFNPFTGTFDDSPSTLKGDIAYTTVQSNSALWVVDTFNTATSASEFLARVANADSVNLERGDVVYTYGSLGDTMSVKKASNVSDTTSARTLGFVNETIIPNGYGYVTLGGSLDKLHLGSYTEGDILWLGTTPGTVTNVRPTQPYHGVYLGVVERANNGNGIAYVKVQNGQELDEIHDVLITSPLSGQTLRRNESNTLWVNTDDGSKWDNVYSNVNTLSSTWSSSPKAFGNEHVFIEQFLNTVSLAGNLNFGTTGGATFAAASSAVFGMASMSTGTTAAFANGRLTSGGSQFTVVGTGSLDYAVKFTQSSASWFDGTLLGGFRSGLMSSSNADSTGMYFRCVNGTTLEFIAKVGSSETSLTLGTISRGVPNLCQFSLNGAGDTITVKYNGSVAGTVSTNIPSGSLFLCTHITRDSAVGTAVIADLDFIALRYIPTTPFFNF